MNLPKSPNSCPPVAEPPTEISSEKFQITNRKSKIENRKLKPSSVVCLLTFALLSVVWCLVSGVFSCLLPTGISHPASVLRRPSSVLCRLTFAPLSVVCGLVSGVRALLRISLRTMNYELKTSRIVRFEQFARGGTSIMVQNVSISCNFC
jgi:hypothetical protein